MKQSRDFRGEILAVKQQYMLGVISYADAIHRCKPILADLNAKKKELDKEAGVRHRPLTFGYVWR